MKTKQDNIILVGLMGAGKTTIGRLLAKRLGKRFVDSDHEVESRTGVSIPVIFEIEGEAGFRKRESMVIEDLSRESGLVMATGGGVVLSPENREAIKAGGFVVYLCAPPELLYARTRNDRNRPLLQVADPLGRLRQLDARHLHTLDQQAGNRATYQPTQHQAEGRRGNRQFGRRGHAIFFAEHRAPGCASAVSAGQGDGTCQQSHQRVEPQRLGQGDAHGILHH